MIYMKSQLESYSPRLRALLYKQDRLFSIDRHAPENEPLFYKIIQVSKEEKVLCVYMIVMLDAMYFFSGGNSRKGIRCAESFLRDGHKLMEEGLSTERYPAAVMTNYMGIFDYIGENYFGFYQISDKKMERFFDIFRKGMSDYGQEWRYYRTRLKWETLSRNKKGAAAAYKSFNLFSIEKKQCYICSMGPVKGYYILMDEFDKAMDQCHDFIVGNIPKEYMGKYETCESANSYRQYMKLFALCIENEKGEMLARVLPLLYREMQVFPEDYKVSCDTAFIFAVYDDFEHWENHVREIVWEIEVGKDVPPYDYMYACLKWMVYLKRLNRTGAEWADLAAEVSLPLLPSEEGKYRVTDLADYFEKLADEIGEKFDKSREGFSYLKRKEFFIELAESPGIKFKSEVGYE